MSIKVLYFARFREALGCASETIKLDQSCRLSELKASILERGPTWQQTLGVGNVLIAVNQELVQQDVLLNPGDELAFFPPVTGG